MDHRLLAATTLSAAMGLALAMQGASVGAQEMKRRHGSNTRLAAR